jgi:hypothetical protein
MVHEPGGDGPEEHRRDTTVAPHPATTTAASRVSAVAVSTCQAAELDSTASPLASSPACLASPTPCPTVASAVSRSHVSKSSVTPRISATGAPFSARPLIEWRSGDAQA